MPIFAIGINHKTAPISLREKAYFALDKLPLYLQDLLARGDAEEAVLLSTCNRSELYCNAYNITPIKNWFCQQTSLSLPALEQALYLYQDEEAIRHMMSVACGMDSMILGEPQILGQMKAAFSESCTAEAVGTVFHRLFQQVFAVAKTIRTTTAIGACPVSVASAAVHFAKLKCAHFSKAKVALLGAGETAQLLLRYLRTHTKNPVTIINRHADKAAPLLAEFGGTYESLHALPTVLAKADIVFSATGSLLPLVTREMIPPSDKPLIFIDVAVPRDIDSAVTQLPHVELYCIDDLKTMIEHHREGREHAAVKASEMIRVKSKECLKQLYSIEKVSHTIRAYRGQIETICRAELAKANQQLQQGMDPEEVLALFAHALTNKLMHTPSVQLRQAGAEGRFELLHFAKQLFAIPDWDVECS